MSRYSPAYVAIALVLLSGVVHGFWTDRWAVSGALAEAAERLERLPVQAGDWQAQVLAVDPRFTEAISGYSFRRYVHRPSGSVVTVALVCGRPGPVSIHTPDVCYRAGGYRVAPPTPYHLAGHGPEAAADFFTSDMQKDTPTGPLYQRIFWSWSATGDWKAPDNPRWEFAARPVLYKLYLIRDMNSAADPLEDDPCVELMRQLLPQLRQSLFP
jgi:hypothetical protein